MNPAGDVVQHALEMHRRAIDAALAAIAERVPGQGSVGSAARYAIGTGGKRLRPALCMIAAEACRQAPLPPPLVRAAAAIELIHTYSLVHDDLPCMDNDDLRRGRPTVHRAFGSPAAIVAGFALIPLACRIVVDACAEAALDAATASDAVGELCAGAGAGGMVGGQVLDLEAEGRELDIAALRRVHAMKTGALFGAALRMGAVLGGGSPGQRDALGRYGADLGLAFQIRDDVLDVTTDAAALGKTPGKDRDSAKATFPALLGVEGADQAARAAAESAIATLRDVGLDHPVLAGLARFAASRAR